MPQLSLYLDDATMAALREDAKVSGVSLSKYAAQAIRSRHSTAWSEGFFELYGSIGDESFEAPREQSWDDDGLSFDDFASRG